MKGKNWIILCFSALLVLVAGIVCLVEQNLKGEYSISLEVVSEGGTEKIGIWEGPGEMYYLFLPSYADMSQTKIRCNALGTVLLDYKPVKDGMDCADLPLNEPMELIYDSLFGYQWNQLTIMRSGNVPTMYVDVRSGNMDHIHAAKGNKESGTMRLYTPEGALDASAVVESIQGRGNSTWQPWLDKKPYSLRLSKDTDLLGMGTGSRWVLLANAFDASNLKNKIAYDLAENAGMAYSPGSQWVDLYLNGVYSGLYLLSERNEIHPNRVDIPETSSFLVSWEVESRMVAQGNPYVKTERGTTLRVHQSGVSLENVQKIWQSVENAIFSEDSVDPVTGKHLQDLIDLDSWAKLYLIDEISAEFDAGRISKFFYYQETDGTGKIYGGPVWDKDDGFAAGHWATTPPNCIMLTRSDMSDRMFYGLYQKEAFSSRVTALYESVFRPLLTQLCDTDLERYANRIAQASELCEFRYNLGYNPQEYLIIQQFLRERMDFLDAYWLGKEEFCRVEIYSPSENYTGLYLVRPGDPIPCLPEYAPEAGNWAWYVEQTGQTYDVTQPVEADLHLLLKQIK